jgi:RNA polymerase sigma-70 factor (ECF subfamily)
VTASPGRGSAVQEELEELALRHRRELHVHCYRMLASFDEAEDAVQETFLRAWRARDGFDGSGTLRAWLYRIATNVCLDQLRSRGRRPTVAMSFAEVPWLQPYPDTLLDAFVSGQDEPDVKAVERETIELAFLVALQVLPARQRAAFVVRDVLGWTAEQTAALLQASVPAANSALQRARATLQEHLPAARTEWPAQGVRPPGGDGSHRAERERAERERAERDLLERFIDAHQRNDAEAAAAIAAQDIRITMPPNPYLFEGIEALRPLLHRAFGPERDGDWRLVPTSANRMPTAASYLRRPGDGTFRAFKFDVLRVREGRICEITTFGPHLFDAFGLPATLDPTG